MKFDAHRLVARARELLTAADRDTIDTQAAIAAIPAPTGAEGQRGRYVADRMRGLGLRDLGTDAAGNVLGWWPGPGDQAVALLAHLDTVFTADTDLSVRRNGPRLSAPGIADNARGLAALLALARAVVETRWTPARPIAFCATVGEEGGGDLRGAKHLFQEARLPAGTVIALDGAGTDRVVHRALGVRRFRVEYHGPGGHSWGAFGVPNPAHAAGTFAAGIAEIGHARHPRTACSVVRLGGGTSLNSIPQWAWAEVDVRSEDASALAALDGELRATAARAQELENGRRAPGTAALRLKVDQISDRPCGETPADHPLVRAAVAATRAVGLEPELTVASTDANVPIALGIPAIAIGAGGRAGDVHLPTEWYDNTDGVLGLVRAMLILAAAAGLD